MAELLVEQLLAEGRAVVALARQILEDSDDDRVRRLASRLPTVQDEPWNLVATGEYNAGKSTLLKALTGDPTIKIDADVATDATTEYQWNDILLVDTPGVGAGHDVHDERAEVALRSADLVLFVLTVSLFDEITEAHFQHVAHDLGKLHQMIVVINKTTQLAAAEGIRRAAVQRSLGHGYALPPIVECDGLAMLRAETESEPDLRVFEEQRSGRRDLVTALDAFVAAEGQTGRTRKPFEAVLALVDDLRPFTVPDDAEDALKHLLARRREGIALSRRRLNNALDDVYAQVTDAITAAGEVVIASARDGVPQSAAVEQFDRDAQAAASSLERKVQDVFARELVNLQAEERGIASGPEARILDEFAVRSTSGNRAFAADNGQGPSSPFVALIQEYVVTQGTSWLKDAVISGNRPGSPTHSLVTNLGHSLGYKFKPWEAVRWAKRFNVAVQVAMTLFQFHQELQAARKEEERDRAALLALRRQIKDAAEGLITQAREEVDPLVSRFYAELAQPVEELELKVGALQQRREALADGVHDLERRSSDALRRTRTNTSAGA